MPLFKWLLLNSNAEIILSIYQKWIIFLFKTIYWHFCNAIWEFPSSITFSPWLSPSKFSITKKYDGSELRFNVLLGVLCVLIFCFNHHFDTQIGAKWLYSLCTWKISYSVYITEYTKVWIDSRSPDKQKYNLTFYSLSDL